MAFVVKLICTVQSRTVGEKVQMEKCLVGDIVGESMVSRILRVTTADV